MSDTMQRIENRNERMLRAIKNGLKNFPKEELKNLFLNKLKENGLSDNEIARFEPNNRFDFNSTPETNAMMLNSIASTLRKLPEVQKTEILKGLKLPEEYRKVLKTKGNNAPVLERPLDLDPNGIPPAPVPPEAPLSMIPGELSSPKTPFIAKHMQFKGNSIA